VLERVQGQYASTQSVLLEGLCLALSRPDVAILDTEPFKNWVR
jgi:hypothetical protein